MTGTRLSLIIAAFAALTVASASAFAKTPSTEGGKPYVNSSTAIETGRANARGDQRSQILLSDAQMDEVTAGLGFDSAGYRAALNVWLVGVQSVLATYTGVETHLPLLTGCSGSGLTGGVCTAGTPPPDPLPFFR